MIDLEAEERRFLQATRRALSPTSADAERVLAAVSQAMVLPSAASAGPALSESGATKTLGAGWRAALPRWLFTAALAGGIGALGYGAGFRAGARSTLSVRSTANPSARSQQNSAREKLSAASETPSAVPLAGDARDAPPRSSPARAGASAAIHSTPKREADALSEEVRTLRRVERALRDQNPRLALALLSELDTSVPSGQFAEERLAASIQARCSLGYGSPSALLEEFARFHPGSAYLTRIRQACEPRRPLPAAPNE
jgi:hypothetical protein